MTKRKVTQEDIAKMLNISRTTVARALHNKGRVSPETQRKVKKLARELGYKANPIAQALARKKVFKIKVFLIKEQSFFWSKVEKGVQMASNELTDFGLDVDIIKTSIDHFGEQVELLKKVDTDDVSGIIVVPLDQNKIKELIDYKFYPNNVPVVALNMDIKDSKRFFYIGPDYLQSGRLAAELIAKFINYQGKVLMFCSDYKTQSAVGRETGFLEKIKSYRNIECISHRIHRLKETYQAVVDKFAEEEIKGIVYPFPKMNYLVNALKDLNILSNVKIVTFDINSEIKTCLEENIVQASILQRPFIQGYVATRTLFDYLINGNKPQSSLNYVSLEIAMKENLNISTPNKHFLYTG